MIGPLTLKLALGTCDNVGSVTQQERNNEIEMR